MTTQQPIYKRAPKVPTFVHQFDYSRLTPEERAELRRVALCNADLTEAQRMRLIMALDA